MMILMVLVIAMFVIVGVYIGSHASQQVEEGETHSINMDLEILDIDSGLVQIIQNPELRKQIL